MAFNRLVQSYTTLHLTGQFRHDFLWSLTA